uniref:Hepcidin antimicrobial peptide n=1 Tax=Myotis myotis TaxID=51298 RepID=A0A7J7SBM2_MYOMY|nr:hepcidin antimicrobial peptide [Myotis myotis]
MALNVRIQAACLLLLLLASLTSASALHQPGLQRRRRRDTHFPICIFCCGCCYPSKCGICCKT